MAKIKNSISTLIETQLPEFITTEYELFGNFLTKYYESLEIQGAPLDIANNLATYSDIGYYESKVLEQSSELVGNLSDSATTITVTDARSFPKENGYIKIEKEICFYKSRTDTEFLEVSRGVSGNTKLGDLYNTTEFVTSQASTHSGGELVQNISNLFLYALVKNFEEQYLASFPEKYLKKAVDKRSLIKNIGQFYRAKGTEKSIQFLFNTVIAGGQENKPEVYNPSDFTYKSSTSDWTQGYALRVKVLSGNVEDLVGQVIVQQEGPRNGYASATVDNVRFDSTVDGEDTYNLFLATETINGIFEFTAKTELTKEILSTDSQGDRINVASTLGWNDKGTLLINGETFTFEDKNITQFEINSRTQTAIHPAGSIVYDPIYIGSGNVQLLVFGLAYNLLPTDAQPYSSVNDPIEVSNPGFETTDPKIVSPQGVRWLLSNTNDKPTSPTNPAYTSNLANLSTDVSAVFSDEQFYYIASSGYPSYPILENVTSIPGNLADQKILKLIRKKATSTTEIYKTPNLDSGIFVNGARVYSYKDTETVRFGKLERITVQNQGSSYKNPPYVLVNGVSGRAVAKLAGQFVESVEVLEPGLYGQTPTVEITSGRGAEVRATITFGAVTDLIIDNPGEYYSTPPLVVITDLAGQGRLAEYTARVSNGEIVGFDLVNQGSFYSQDNVRVTILPVGQNAVATPELTEWVKDRYYNLQNKLDDNNGFVFENYNRALEYGYAHVANPKSLRVRLNDNLSSLGVEPATKVHSPILGFAYDGNPIYGPFAHQNPLDQQSPVVRMTSSYILKPSRSFGPSTQDYPLGSFIQDYEYRHQSGSLDQNNGRFCVTPDFPEGTYAYFITINSQQVPQFPYVIGENFYSLPVESNYASNLNQTNLSKNVKRLFTPGLQVNGGGVNAIIQDLESGSIESIDVESSSDSFSVGCSLVFDNSGTEGNGVEATVNSVKGKSVNYLQSFESKVVKLVITRDSYVFAGDFLRQPGSGAFGTIVGDVRADNTILVKDVNGTFDDSATFSTDIKVVRLTIDKVSSFAQGSVIQLTDGVVTVAAEGEVLESIVAGNTLIVKVTSGTFEDQENLPGYFIKSSSLSDTSGAKIDDVEYLSDGLVPFDIDDNIALVETSSEHKLGIGDVVNVSINPDDATKTRTYFVRKRIYQELQLQTPTYNTVVNYSGIGRGIVLNSGSLYDVGSYTNIPLTGGSGEGATANIVVSPDTPNSVTGYISDIQISDGGTGYKRGDVLGVADSSLGKVPGSSTQTLRFFIDHVGISAESTRIDVKSAVEYAENDLLKIDDEIVKIVSLTNNQVQGGTLIVERAQLGTKAVDHYDGATVSLYDGGYNFDANFTVNGSESVIYNKEKQTLLVIYPSTQSLSTLQAITETTTFFDDSTPQRFVNIITASSAENRFEFRLDPSMSIFGTAAPNTYTSDWVVNPIIEVQEFYKYRFDTSDNSLTGASLDFSPSGNYNIISVEKTEPAILQGSPGSFVEMKFGFGAAIASNQYTEEEASRFTNYFYFDRNNTISSSGSYLTVIQDPLAGRQVVNYVTPTRFSYSLKKNPQWDGSGDISYTTTGSFAVGKIDSVSIQNIGSNYKKTPIVLGAYLNTESQASATVLFDPLLDTITSVRVDVEGSNYSKPKVVILEGDGIDAEFGVTSRDGKVLDIFVINKGTDYTKAPTIAIIESDVKLFAQGSRIGRPKNVKMVKNGSSFHRDNTLLSEYTSSYTFAVTGYGDSDFLKGETITQTSGNDIILRAKVNEWRHGSNLLKLSNIQGNVRNNLPLVGEISKTSATIKSEYKTVFDLDLRPYSNNTGSYRSDRGKLGVSNQRLTDSFFYQDYSYVVKSRTAIDNWRELVKETTHPAGFKLFGEVIIDPVIDDGITMPTEMPKASHFSIIELWDADKNKVTVESTTRTITQSVLSVDDYRAIKGSGSVAVNEFDFNYTNAFELTLKQSPTDPSPLDGAFNSDGQLVGTRSFTLYNNGAPFNPYSAENLIVTIDGVLQEPGVAYTISSNQIVFATPPLGYNVVEGQDVYEQKVLIRYIEFKNDVYNDKHFRKIRNFYQRNGRWLDAANQILLNVDFIVAESIGYFESKYASEIANATIPWTAIENKVQGDIRNLCTALEHDLRFGGNVKSVDYAELFASSYSAQNTQINDLFQYVVRLAKLAARNWDWIAIGASYTAGSDIITISDTSNIALGAVVSSGQAIPLSSGYKVIEIVSDTEVRIDGTALVDSDIIPPGSGGPGTTFLSGTQSGSVTIPTATAAVVPPNTYGLPPGTTLTTPPLFAGVGQVMFSFSGINNGTFYDASNLIEKNRNYITDYAINWASSTYPNLDWGDTTRLNANIVPITRRSLDENYFDITSKGDGYEDAVDCIVVPTAGTAATQGNAMGGGYNIIPRLEYKGYIKRVDILDGGSGYTQPPIISFPGDMENVYAVAEITGGVLTSILISGEGFSTTTADNVYEFGPGTTIAQNGTGIGEQGGFNIGGTHLRFGDTDGGERYCIFKPYDTRDISVVRVFAIRGDDTNGGEIPEGDAGDERLRLGYQIVSNPSEEPDENSWIDLGVVIGLEDEDPDGGVLKNYDITLPMEAQSEYVYFRLIQPDNSGTTFDNFGVLSVSFIEALVGDPNGPRYSNFNVNIETNPLDTGTPTRASAKVVLGKGIESLEISNPGSGFLASDTDLFVKMLDGQGQVSDFLAEVRTKKTTTFNVIDGGYGYKENPDVILTYSGNQPVVSSGSARATVDENGTILSVETVEEGDYNITLTGASIDPASFLPVGANRLNTKCARDIGYLLDAVIYSLRFGGNQKLVEFAELYFVGSQLNYIVGEFAETKATYEKILKELCVQAMLQTLPGTTTYTTIQPVIDPEVIVDVVIPACAGVEAALNTYYDIIETILNTGPNVIQITSQNPTKPGFYTNLVPYANYDIIPDSQLVSGECEDVVSSLSTYASIIEEYMVSGNTITKSLPDFIDNETSEFELYWDDDGSPVALTETDEHLLVAFNGVIQRPKYNPDEPAFDSYWVDRTVTPNVIKFTAPPIWDQDLSAKTIQEPTMVEKFFATNIGNYRRYTIDKSLINGVRKGPFLILSVDGDRILNIDDQNYMIVIVNGVIQKPTTAYEVAGASITFKYPMRDEDVVDIRLCYGRDLDPTVTFHDFDINGYLYDYTLEVNGTNAGVNFNSFALTSDWALTTKDKFYIYQEDSNGTYGIGSVYDWKAVGSNQVVIKMYSNNIDYDPSRATYMKTMGANAVSTYTFDPSYALTLTKNYEFLSRTDKSYFAQDVKKSNDLLQRKGFFRLAPGDKVKIDGESQYRTIRSIPDEVYTRDNRLDGDAGNDIYGSFGISSYNGKTMGEGLSVSAEITNGVVTALKWNERIVEPITNSDGSITYKFYRPTAFNYETPPKLMFVPRDGNGGGARAVVLVERGYIQGIQLLYGGSGYTEAPKVVVTRKYDIKKQDDIKVSLVKIGVEGVVSQGLTVISNVSAIGLPPPGQALISIVVLDSVQDVRDAIEQEIQPDPVPDAIMASEPRPIKRQRTIYLDPVDVGQSDTANRYVQSVLAVRAEDVVSISQLTTNRFINKTIQREIANTFLDNVIYRAPGAYLQAPLNIGDTIVYIPDTSKFTSYGKLMVGDEVVFYPRKRGDRFLNVTRGFEGTTEKNWAPGTFIRQIEDFVSVAYGGVAEIYSETVVRNSIPTGITERKTQQQVETPATSTIQTEIQHTSELQLHVDVESISSVSKEIVKTSPAGGNNIISDFTNFRPVATVTTAEIEVQTKVTTEVQNVVSELLFFAPPGGVVDYFQEILFFTNPVATRLNGNVTLVTRDVTQRSGTDISIRNISEDEQVSYVGNYTVGNVGPNISSWEIVVKDTGTLGVSDISIAEFELVFPLLTLRDFELRGYSNYTLSGQKFNLGLPTINNTVTVCFTSGSIGSAITVRNTDYFPTSGYVFHGSGATRGVIQYTGKTATTFTGCTVYSGSSTITNGSEVIPFAID